MTEDSEPHKRRRVPSNIRSEKRHAPSTFMPQTYLFLPDRDQPLIGVTREESDHGSSATFDYPFPLEPGDIVDARVGNRRAWAEIVWVRDVMKKKTLVGLRFRTED